MKQTEGAGHMRYDGGIYNPFAVAMREDRYGEPLDSKRED